MHNFELFKFDFNSMKIVFATNNANKLKEVQALIPNHIQLIGLEAIGCFEEVPETQETIEGNAIQKVEYIKSTYGYDCFADDTGLEVTSLNGEPGVYSGRYAGEQRNAHDNMDKLLTKLKGEMNRSAQFKTVVALHLNGKTLTFTGICKGEVTASKQGKDGFGYDPIFKAEGFEKTFAEISLAEKNEIGHRGKAVQQLVNYLSNL